MKKSMFKKSFYLLLIYLFPYRFLGFISGKIIDSDPILAGHIINFALIILLGLLSILSIGALQLIYSVVVLYEPLDRDRLLSKHIDLYDMEDQKIEW